MLAALHRAREARLPFPAALALTKPLTNFRTFRSPHSGQRSRAEFFDQYPTGHDPTDPTDPTISPALGTLADLPPLPWKSAAQTSHSDRTTVPLSRPSERVESTPSCTKLPAASTVSSTSTPTCRNRDCLSSARLASSSRTCSDHQH
jgi:acetyl esterase/lipase